MDKNPYKYLGPLDPAKDTLICVRRTEDVGRVIDGIRRGVYWVVLGASQTGKTTFLRQIRSGFPEAYYIYLNFEGTHARHENLYRWLIEQILDKVPSDGNITLDEAWDKDIPVLSFIRFLERFKGKDAAKKIIFLFDEITNLPDLRNFLHIWRKVFQDRYEKKELNIYSVVIAGSSDLIAQTTGPTSPFNIAEILYLKDFSEEESVRLIAEPCHRLGIKIEKKAQEKLLDQISGHPQMLQQVCHILVDMATKGKNGITEKDVANAISLLFKTSSILDLLKQETKINNILSELIGRILNREHKEFFQYKEFAFSGSGCIKEGNGSFCEIRNKLFERFLRVMYENVETDPEVMKENDSITKKYQEGEVIKDDSLKQYTIIKKIGKGGMGVVFKAKDMKLKRVVALKMLNNKIVTGKRIQERFHNEALTIASLNHPNIVKVHDFGKVGNDYFISMEFIEGEDLLTKINKFIEFTYIHVLYIAKELLKALHYAHTHTKKVIHRDVKPHNIMVNSEGEIKIVDFGLAMFRGRDVKVETGCIMGTIFYISPEQLQEEKIDQRTDIYSTGVTMFHLLAGTVPFKGKDIQGKHLGEPVPVEKIGKDVPEEVVNIIKKCMEKDRKDRYQSAMELLFDIQEVERKLLGRDTALEDIGDIAFMDEGTVEVLKDSEKN